MDSLTDDDETLALTEKSVRTKDKSKPREEKTNLEEEAVDGGDDEAHEGQSHPHRLARSLPARPQLVHHQPNHIEGRVRPPPPQRCRSDRLQSDKLSCG